MNDLNIIKFSQFLRGEQIKIDNLIKESLDIGDKKNHEELTQSLNLLIEKEKVNSTQNTEFLKPGVGFTGDPEIDDAFNPPVDIEDFEPVNETPPEVDETKSLPHPDYVIGDVEMGPVEEKEIGSVDINESYYELFRDKSEDFSCELKIQGANVDDTDVRLVIESENWNIMFKGNVDSYGRCLIPMKKLNILNEGDVGTIKLEVIAENTVFIPWENNFRVKNSKKVNFVLNENKKNTKKVTLVKTDIKLKNKTKG